MNPRAAPNLEVNFILPSLGLMIQINFLNILCFYCDRNNWEIFLSYIPYSITCDAIIPSLYKTYHRPPNVFSSCRIGRSGGWISLLEVKMGFKYRGKLFLAIIMSKWCHQHSMVLCEEYTMRFWCHPFIKISHYILVGDLFQYNSLVHISLLC